MGTTIRQSLKHIRHSIWSFFCKPAEALITLSQLDLISMLIDCLTILIMVRPEWDHIQVLIYLLPWACILGAVLFGWDYNCFIYPCFFHMSHILFRATLFDFSQIVLAHNYGELAIDLTYLGSVCFTDTVHLGFCEYICPWGGDSTMPVYSSSVALWKLM